MKYEDALASYHAALEIDERKKEAYGRIASVHHMNKEYEKSLETLEQGLAVLEKRDMKEEATYLQQFKEIAENHLESREEPEHIGLYPREENGKWGFENAEEELICDYIYEEIKPYNTAGLAAVKKDGKWGFIDQNGKEVIPCQYEDLKLFTNQGCAAFCQNGKWGYLNKNGEVIVEPSYEEAGDFGSNGLAAVKKDGKWGYINEKGETVIAPKYDAATIFTENGLAIVEKEGKQYWINESDMLLKMETGGELCGVGKGGEVILLVDGKYGLVNYEGEILAECMYDSMESIPGWEGLYKVGKDGKFGCIDKKGEIMLEIEYEDFIYYDKEHLGYFKRGDAGENIVGMKYEGEDPEYVEGSYEYYKVTEASDFVPGGNIIEGRYIFDKEGKCVITVKLSPVNIRVVGGNYFYGGMEWYAGSEDVVEPGESEERTFEFPYKINDEKIYIYGEVPWCLSMIPLSEINIQKEYY